LGRAGKNPRDRGNPQPTRLPESKPGGPTLAKVWVHPSGMGLRYGLRPPERVRPPTLPARGGEAVERTLAVRG
jgi:hypothetical protein